MINIKYWVNDQGIVEMDEDHPNFNNEELAIFEDLNSALIFAINSISSRIAELEKYNSLGIGSL